MYKLRDVQLNSKFINRDSIPLKIYLDKGYQECPVESATSLNCTFNLEKKNLKVKKDVEIDIINIDILLSLIKYLYTVIIYVILD